MADEPVVLESMKQIDCWLENVETTVVDGPGRRRREDDALFRGIVLRRGLKSNENGARARSTTRSAGRSSRWTKVEKMSEDRPR